MVLTFANMVEINILLHNTQDGEMKGIKNVPYDQTLLHFIKADLYGQILDTRRVVHFSTFYAVF